MVAFFRQLFASRGVDEDRKPNAGMIVPVDGFNVVGLDGTLVHLKATPDVLNIDKLKGAAGEIMGLLSMGLNPLGRYNALALTYQYFRISPKHRIPISAVVEAVSPYGTEAKLDVQVLKPRNVKLSIRPVQVRGPQGDGLVYHRKRPFDPKAMVDQMNSIWTPQANVVFTLIS